MKSKKKNNNKNWWWKNLYTAEIKVLFRVQKEFETLEKKTFEHVEFMKISRDLGKAKSWTHIYWEFWILFEISYGEFWRVKSSIFRKEMFEFSMSLSE